MNVNSDFKELLQYLNKEGVKYLVIGEHAVMTYTEPRYTKDLDIWIEPTIDNAGAVLKALSVFGAPSVAVTAQDLTDPEIIYQVGVAPVRVDIISHIPGLLFETAWPKRTTIELDGLSVFIIGKDDLITSKMASGRKQDKADIRSLKKKR